MTAAGLTDRFRSERGGPHLGGLVATAVLIVAAAAVARTDAAERVFADWLVAVLPAIGFAVGGAVLGHVMGSHPLMARTPRSVLGLCAPDRGADAPGLADRVAGVHAGAVISPFVVAAAVVSFAGDDRAILVCAWLLTALCAAAGAAWAVMPALGRGARGAAPVGRLRTGGTVVAAGDPPDGLGAVSSALRAAALGTGIAALTSGVLPDTAVAWASQRPAAAAAYAVVVAFVAAPGAEAGCFAAGVFAAFGPAAVVAFAATAAVCDVRLLRLLQMLVGRGVAWRTSVAALPVVYAGAVWTGVLLR